MIQHNGMEMFLHLVRASDDPERSPRPSGRRPERVPRRVLNKAPPEEWSSVINDHLSDGVARTFNRIMIELANVTADVAFRENPDQGLWALVENNLVDHTATTPIYFFTPFSELAIECPYCSEILAWNETKEIGGQGRTRISDEFGCDNFQCPSSEFGGVFHVNRDTEDLELNDGRTI